MERKIEKQLLSWKNRLTRLPLILQGARQVGKTYSLLQFGRRYYRDVAYFNFEASLELQRIFDRDLNPSRLIRELSALTSASVIHEDTLVIFDEIQACERALTSLKYFAEETPQYHIAAAGSLLGVAINRESHSYPVGKVELLTLYPLDFEEFLLAQGKESAVEVIRESFLLNIPCSLHQSLMDQYRIYIGVGGMPQVLNEFLTSADYNFVMALQKNIIGAYISDMAKHASATETVRIMAVFNSLPAQLAKENRKFQYKTIKSGGRAYHYETAIDWLTASSTVVKCLKINKGEAPLVSHCEADSFKIYMADTGLLCSSYSISPTVFQQESAAWQSIKGILAENFVANALVANHFIPYYWESEGKAELDFVIQNRTGEVIPIEVKSSDNIRSKSLQQFITKYNPPWSLRISAKNFGYENNIKSIPLYAVFCLTN